MSVEQLLDNNSSFDAKDIIAENILRPKKFDDYIGQIELIQRLDIAIKASKQRGESCPSMLFFAGPGMGKTSLANVIANEYGAKYHYINSCSVRNEMEMIEVVSKVQTNDIVFFDEMHSLNKKVSEVLYPILEDGFAAIKLPNKEVINIKINPCCMIGATNMIGKMAPALRDRFELIHNFVEYSDEELTKIVAANSHKLKLKIYDEAIIKDIASKSRGIPRISVRLLRRIRDFAQINNNMIVDAAVLEESMKIEGIREDGFTNADHNYMRTLFSNFKGGPAGIDAISVAISEDKTTLSDFIEPFLVKRGLIARTPRGRVITSAGIELLMKQKYRSDKEQAKI